MLEPDPTVGDWVKTRLDFNTSNCSWIHTTAWRFSASRSLTYWNGTQYRRVHLDKLEYLTNLKPWTCGRFGMIPLYYDSSKVTLFLQTRPWLIRWSSALFTLLGTTNNRHLMHWNDEWGWWFFLKLRTSPVCCTITYPEMSPRKTFYRSSEVTSF